MMNRRELLQSISAAPFMGAAMPEQRQRETVKTSISDLEIFRVKVNKRGDWVLLRLRASNGLTGLGEASHSGANETVIQLLREYVRGLKSRSVFDIAWLRQWGEAEIAKRGTAAKVATSAIEQACWDIQGQTLGVPVYQLFGGKLRDRIRQYANTNRSADPRTPEGFAGMAERAAAAGFDAVKLAPFDGLPKNTTAEGLGARVSLGIECAVAVRQTLGEKRDLLVDLHSLFNKTQAIEIASRLEPLKLFWLEEVTPHTAVADMAAVKRVIKMPIAAGEQLYGVKEFYDFVAVNAVHTLMPDIKYCGGMLELKKIAALGEAVGMNVSPHGPASPVGNIAAAHICAGLPNFNILEFAFGEVPWRSELIDPPELIERSHLTLSERPGFGIKLNDKIVKEHQVL